MNESAVSLPGVPVAVDRGAARGDTGVNASILLVVRTVARESNIVVEDFILLCVYSLYRYLYDVGVGGVGLCVNRRFCAGFCSVGTNSVFVVSTASGDGEKCGAVFA